MRLIEAWKADPAQAYGLFRQFPADENGFVNEAFGMERGEFDAWLASLEDRAAGIGLPAGYVPDTTYILATDDGAYVGVFKLRHRLNDFLRRGPGHIGYGIAPDQRGKGYATAGLRLALDRARDEFGITEAYLEAHRDNPASLKVQRHCGARIVSEDDVHYHTRIPTARAD